MGLLSDLFITTPPELQSLDIRQSPAQSLPSVRARRIEVVKLVQLQCIMDGSSFNDHLNSLGDMIVRSASDDGRWVVLVPNALTRALAEADRSQLEEMGRLWASTEEWLLDGGREEEIISLIKEIATLARKAVAGGQNLYCWISL